MGSINAATAGMPQRASATGYGNLSSGAINQLNGAGVPASTIDIANDIVGSTRPPVSNSAPQYPVGPQPTVTPQNPPAASQQQTSAPSTANLDGPDATYPTLTSAHVMLLKAVGTPPEIISQFAAQNVTSSTMDQWIQSELMQAPEKWDELCGNTVGTARAGLQQLMPNVQLPAPGAGNPTQPTTSGIPSISVSPDSVTIAKEDGMNDLMKGLVIAGGLALAGFVGYKFFKGRGAKQAAAAAGQIAGGGEGVARTLGMAAGQGGAGVAGAAGGAMDMGSQMMMMGRPSQAWQMARGLPPGLEHSGQAMNMAGLWNLSGETALRQARFEMGAGTNQLLEAAIWEHGPAMAPVLDSLAHLRGGGAAAADASLGASATLGKLLDGDRLAKLVKLADMV